MTFAQAKRFYQQDTKDYEIGKNEAFLNWLKSKIADGYNCFIETDELQELIDYITNWYEIKYPERELEYFEGTRSISFQDIKRMSDVMTIRQLLYRLSHNQLCLMECGYRANGGGLCPIYEDGKIVGEEDEIFLRIGRKAEDKCNLPYGKLPYCLLYANCMTGEVSRDYRIKKYLVGEESIRLEELLTILNDKYADELDFTELKECVNNHNVDMELRQKILQLVALKLLYSKNTIPERGYIRAKRFIDEFNKKLGLSLTMEEIDEIMRRDYTNGEKCSYTSIDNVAKHEKFGWTRVLISSRLKK